jgi:hypothetical protein
MNVGYVSGSEDLGCVLRAVLAKDCAQALTTFYSRFRMRASSRGGPVVFVLQPQSGHYVTYIFMRR